MEDTGQGTFGELNIARDNVLRLEQDAWFEGQWKSHSSLETFNPARVDGRWPVGGKLQQIDGAIQPHPILLPANHPVTELIIHSAHESSDHILAAQVLADVRQRHLILKGISQMERGLLNCLKCKLLYFSPVGQIILPLPPERVLPGDRPFLHRGVDNFGPFKVRIGQSHKRCHEALSTARLVNKIRNILQVATPFSPPDTSFVFSVFHSKI